MWSELEQRIRYTDLSAPDGYSLIILGIHCIDYGNEKAHWQAAERQAGFPGQHLYSWIPFAKHCWNSHNYEQIWFPSLNILVHLDHWWECFIRQSSAFHVEKLRKKKTHVVQDHALRKSLAEPKLISDFTTDFTNWTQILQLPSQGLLQKSIFRQYWMPPITLFLCWGKPIFQCNLCQRWIYERLILKKLWTSFANLYCDSWENRSAIFHRDVLRTDTWKIIRYSDSTV